MPTLAPPATSSEVSRLRELMTRKRWQEALRLGEQLLSHDLDPGIIETLGKRLVDARFKPQAISWMKSAVAVHSDNVSLQCLLAETLAGAGDLRQAAGVWVAILELDPLCEKAHSKLPATLMELGLFDEARVACNLALHVLPDSIEAHETLGRIHELAGDNGGAIEEYSRALSLKPGLLKVRHRRALLLIERGEWAAARADLEGLALAQPKDVETKFVLSRVLINMGDTQTAIQQLRRIIALRPKFPAALINLGSQLRKAGEFDEAERCFKMALKHQMNNPIAWHNLANLQVELARVDEAERAYSLAIENDPKYIDAHVARAMVHLLKGRFTEGWDEYEWRLEHESQRTKIYNHGTLKRENWSSSRILLCAEQGAGDTFQFIRYAANLAKGGAKVFLECPKPFHVLMHEIPELSAVVSKRSDAPSYTHTIPLMSLPMLCGTTGSSIPATIPYLKAPQGRALPPSLQDCSKLKVGFVWAGNRMHANDRNRSVSAEMLLGLADNPDIQAFSLQMDGSSECTERVIDLAPSITDYGDTAAFLDAMDLLISVDTSVAHLAGALGRPVWLLLPVCNDWRWMLNREDSPWYPTMRIFRQKKLGDWTSVMETLDVALRVRVQEGRA